MNNKVNKVLLAKQLGIARSTLYYVSKQASKDWYTKQLIEQVLHNHPSYGHKRIAIELKLNKKRILRVMNLYGIKPYRRIVNKYKKTKVASGIYPNLLLFNIPQYENHIWVSDFTHVSWKKRNVYIGTILDLYTKRVIGYSVMLSHTVWLVKNTLFCALNTNQRPSIFHSDNGSEFDAKSFKEILINLNISISRSRPACPWENGYQESFYGKFKVDLGEVNRFETLGELVYEIYQTIWKYNNTRIHTILKCSPNEFKRRCDIIKELEN